MVGFAVSLLVLSVLLIAFIDATRWLSAWSSATEATRLGARLAAICVREEASARAIRAAMLGWLVELDSVQAASVIRIDYEDDNASASNSCTESNCRQVSVYLDGYRISALGGLARSGGLPLPALRSSVPRESLSIRSGACAASS